MKDESEEPIDDDTIGSDSSSIDEFPAFTPDSENQPAVVTDESDLIGKMVGPYRVLQVLGRGGMGVVYLAEQRQPMRRRVALKVIKANQNSDLILSRFAAERQALAMMDHPHIAKVFDGGDDAGRPYFAMEYVRGIPLTEYCDQNKHTVEQRLRLFVDICRAVQHAHQKGIIHRDLKPSNILVEEIDHVLSPKVIDFGLAKALDAQSKLTDETFFTEFGRIVGTIQYMSPEQAQLNQLDVDTRADVYSLGVVLYELLTGTRPLNDETIKQKALLEVLQMIREEEPAKPSSRLSDHDESAVEAGQRRRITSAKLEQIIRGDLDWVVLKALEKDRSRRYGGAGEFADDVENYLEGNPVKARRPTFGYRLSKYTRKHRIAAATILITVSSVLLGLVSSGLLAIQLNRSLNRAKEVSRREMRAKETLADRNQALKVTNQRLNAAFLVGYSLLEAELSGDRSKLLNATLDTIEDKDSSSDWNQARMRLFQATPKMMKLLQAEGKESRIPFLSDLQAIGKSQNLALQYKHVHELLDEAIALDPTLGLAYLARAELRSNAFTRLHEGRGPASQLEIPIPSYDDVLDDWNRAVELLSEAPDVYSGRAFWLHQFDSLVRNTTKAQENSNSSACDRDLATALAIDPDHHAALRLSGVRLAGSGDRKQALERLQQAFHAPESPLDHLFGRNSRRLTAVRLVNTAIDHYWSEQISNLQAILPAGYMRFYGIYDDYWDDRLDTVWQTVVNSFETIDSPDEWSILERQLAFIAFPGERGSYRSTRRWLHWAATAAARGANTPSELNQATAFRADYPGQWQCELTRTQLETVRATLERVTNNDELAVTDAGEKATFVSIETDENRAQ